MLTFGLIPATDANMYDFIMLYSEHYGQQVKSAAEVCNMLRSFYRDGYLTHFSAYVTREGKPVAAMGILYDKERDEFIFTHLVTHSNYRKKRLAKNCILYGTEMLKILGPKRIKNHKRMNVIPTRYFEQLGMVEKEVDPEKIGLPPEYNLRYTWDNPGVSNAKNEN